MPPRNEQALSWQVPPSPQVATLTAPGGTGGGLRERVGGREEQSAEPCQLNHSAERVGYLCHSKLWMAATARLGPPGQGLRHGRTAVAPARVPPGLSTDRSGQRVHGTTLRFPVEASGCNPQCALLSGHLRWWAGWRRVGWRRSRRGAAVGDGQHLSIGRAAAGSWKEAASRVCACKQSESEQGGRTDTGLPFRPAAQRPQALETRAA